MAAAELEAVTLLAALATWANGCVVAIAAHSTINKTAAAVLTLVAV
jgi:hypothetical protein